MLVDGNMGMTLANERIGGYDIEKGLLRRRLAIWS
jgi:hypothetical protein